jgi:hypothetical protein
VERWKSEIDDPFFPNPTFVPQQPTAIFRLSICAALDPFLIS